MGTLRSLTTNNVRCGNLINCCHSAYEFKLLEPFSELIPSEDREKTVPSVKRVSQTPVIGRWLMAPRARTASHISLTRKRIVSQISRIATSGAYLSGSTPWRGARTPTTLSSGTSPPSLARLPDHLLTSDGDHPRVCGNCGHELLNRRDSKFSDLGAWHVTH